MASLDVISALRKAREDKSVKAVVLRIDSPGAPQEICSVRGLRGGLHPLPR